MKKNKKKALRYEPYRGGGGPTTKQINRNNRFLQFELKQAWEIESVYDEDKLADDTLTPENRGISLLIIKHPNPNRRDELIVGYDRWGFQTEIDGRGQNLCLIDQGTLADTMMLIKRWFDGKKVHSKKYIERIHPEKRFLKILAEITKEAS